LNSINSFALDRQHLEDGVDQAEQRRVCSDASASKHRYRGEGFVLEQHSQPEPEILA
jgi:hypothetical protein